MTQKFSYHTHTTFSDGKNSAEEMIKKAKELGWEEIGVSDHLVVHKNIKNLPDYGFTAFKKNGKDPFMFSSFAEIKEEAKKHFEELDRLSRKYRIKVLKGFEVDYFTYSGWEEEFKDFKIQLNPDYLISGNHFFASDDCELLYDIYYVKHHAGKSTDSLSNHIARHYKSIEKAIESNLFDFVAHLDYSRAVGDSVDLFKEEKISVIKKLAEYNVATELSTKGLRRQGFAYPAPWLLDVARECGVAIVVSDDAHSTNELGALFDVADTILGGYNNRFKL